MLVKTRNGDLLFYFQIFLLLNLYTQKRQFRINESVIWGIWYILSTFTTQKSRRLSKLYLYDFTIYCDLMDLSMGKCCLSAERHTVLVRRGESLRIARVFFCQRSLAGRQHQP